MKAKPIERVRPRIPDYRPPQPKKIPVKVPEYRPPMPKNSGPKKIIPGKSSPLRKANFENEIQPEKNQEQKFQEIESWAKIAGIDALKREQENNLEEMLKVTDDKLRLLERKHEIISDRIANINLSS